MLVHVQYSYYCNYAVLRGILCQLAANHRPFHRYPAHCWHPVSSRAHASGLFLVSACICRRADYSPFGREDFLAAPRYCNRIFFLQKRIVIRNTAKPSQRPFRTTIRRKKFSLPLNGWSCESLERVNLDRLRCDNVPPPVSLNSSAKAFWSQVPKRN